jgi:hypothetical protein
MESSSLVSPEAEPAIGPRGSAAPRRSALVRWVERGLVLAAMTVVVWFFHWTVKANSGFDDWGNLDYFKLLVRGWMKGQLNMDIEPAPELLALADPYDPTQNERYKLGDATLYKGKYYIYFGPSPALTLMLPYRLLTGREMTMGAATFVFCSLAFLVSSGLWLAIRRRYFPGSGLLIAPLGVLALGFGTHLLALAQRPMIWELPISSGIAFTMLALASCYAALHGRRPRLAMACAGLFLGLAVGARPTCLLAVVMLAVPLWAAWREPGAGRKWLGMGIAALVPLALCGLAIAAHNYARFDNPLEFGQRYQLSGAYEGKWVHFSLRFLAHNFSVYFFQLLRWTAEFPFALAVGIPIDHIPGYFGTEEVAGLAVTFPFVWFALALPLAWLRRAAPERRLFTLSMAVLAGAVLPVMTLVMCYFSTTTRYQADFAIGFAMVALTGLLGLERWAQLRTRVAGAWLARLSAAGLIATTVFIGVLMSFDYHARSMQITAPKNWSDLTNRTYGLLTRAGMRFGNVEGPQQLKVRFQQRPVGTVETFWTATDPATGERILVEHIGERLIRFGYVRGVVAPTWGRPLRWDPGHTHTVSVHLPSLYRLSEDSWWTMLQRRSEFRMRTSVAVWFSGGRALGLVVPALPRGFAGGGAVGKDFSGEIRARVTRPYREDEIEYGLVDYWAKRGGVLRMRIMFPEQLQENGEPIFTTGAHYRSSIVFVQAAPGGKLQFVFENYTFPRIESEPFQANPAGHLVELEMASFNPDKFGEEATGDVVVRLDGRELMRTRQVAYPSPWGQETIGTNPFGTTCAPEFRGWIYDARWVQ